MHEKVLEIAEQLLCPKVQSQVRDEYSDPKNSFLQFQRKLQLVIMEAKHQRGSTMHQLTIHDIFTSEQLNIKSLVINF